MWVFVVMAAVFFLIYKFLELWLRGTFSTWNFTRSSTVVKVTAASRPKQNKSKKKGTTASRKSSDVDKNDEGMSDWHWSISSGNDLHSSLSPHWDYNESHSPEIYPLCEDPMNDEIRIVLLKQQISYYFSFNNLIKDIYLRSWMDEQGYIPIEIIASFNCIKIITDDIRLIMNAIADINELELSDNLVRCRDDPLQWIIRNEHTNFTGSNLNPKAMDFFPRCDSVKINSEVFHNLHKETYETYNEGCTINGVEQDNKAINLNSRDVDHDGDDECETDADKYKSKRSYANVVKASK